MNVKLRLRVASPTEVIEGLFVDADPALRRARDVARQAHVDHERATQPVLDAGARVDQLRVDVPAGRGYVHELEAAVHHQHAAAIALQGYQARAAQADADVATALVNARAAVEAEAGRRRDRLQETADELAPVLEALRDAERALDNAVAKLGGRGYVEPVVWPSCAEYEGGRG